MAKDLIDVGDRICIPTNVQEFPLEKQDCHYNEEEVNFICSLVLYKANQISNFQSSDLMQKVNVLFNFDGLEMGGS